MLDFNAKKDILKRLRRKGSENVLMRVLCAVAAVFVKLWYGAVCGIGMAFSDKNGNFLGIKMPERKPKARRQDDIVYVKKPFIGRVMSVVLAAAFVLMIAPELSIDLGVRASALDWTNTDTIGDDSVIRTNPTSTDEAAQYILEKDAIFANSETITPGTYHTSDSSIYITWESYNLPYRVSEYNTNTGAGLDVTNFVAKGYTILVLTEPNGSWASPVRRFEVNQGTSFLINKDSADVSGSRFNNFDPNTPYYIVVLPRFEIQKYIRVREETTETDESGNPKYREYIQKLTSDKYYDLEYRVQNIGSGDCVYNAVTANAKLDKPVLEIENESYTSIRPYLYDGTVKLKWNKVVQLEGTGKTATEYGGADAGLPATGYRVYISTDGGRSWSEARNLRMNDNVDNITCDYPGDMGVHYQFYVEAYKENWPNSGGDGIIYSRSDDVELYIAPNTPQITRIEQNVANKKPPFYEITIAHGGNENYTGVYLFRTTNVELTEENTPENEFDTFGEWLMKNSSQQPNGNPEYCNLKYIPNAFDNTNTYRDQNIVEGATYFYYVVAYTSIPRGSNAPFILYSSVCNTGSTTFRLDGFKSTKPSLPTLDITDDQITVNWNAINGAESYEIEIVQIGTHNDKNETVPIPEENQTSRIEPTDSNTYPDKGLLYSDRYKYRIRGIVNMDTVETLPDGTTQNVKPITTLWSEWVEGTVGTRIGTPTITDVVSADGQLTVRWTAVPGAAGYYLEYENVNDRSDKGTITVSNGSTSYVHRNLKNGNVYRYRVCAYKEIKIPGRPQESQLVSGNYSDWYTPVRVGDELLIPQNLRLTTKDGEITAVWDSVRGATGYILYSKKDGTFGNPDEFRVSGTTFTQTGLTNGDVYTYQVRAVKRVNGEDDTSGLSTPASIKVGVELATPQNVKTTTKDGEITITWAAVPSATSYKLHYRNITKGTSGVFNVTNSPFTHTGLNNGDVYEYYITAYKDVNGKPVDGPESVTITQMVGAVLDTPKDFTAETKDGTVNLKWTAVKGAEGYIIYASSGGQYLQFDVSKVTYAHTGLENGSTWSYRVAAYKTVNGVRTYSPMSETKTVTVGVSLNSAVDLTATAGNRQIDLKWTAVKGAEGYVVYLYNSKTMEFDPITATSKTNYSHVGLKNGKQYTYMVAPYKNIDGKRYYGEYSMAVTAIPTTGSLTDMDHELRVKGTSPYGISHGEYISAVSNHAAFDESVDVYFTTNRESTKAVKDVLKNYAKGLSSFIVYPFDISIYKENTFIKVDPADGFFVTITMPIPDRLIAYRDYITVIHINENAEEAEDITDLTLAGDWIRSDDQRLEVLPCAVVDIDNVWCIQFKCTNFSPYALVIYKEHILDIATGGGILDGGFAGTFNSGVLLFTALPDIMPNTRRLKIVQEGAKRYRIKSIVKR